MPTEHQQAAAATLARLMELVQTVSPSITAASLRIFCAVAVDEGQPVTTYAQATGQPLSTASRQLLDLSERVRAQKDGQSSEGSGHKLLQRVPNPENLREVLYRLSPAGKGLLFRVGQALARRDL